MNWAGLPLSRPTRSFAPALFTRASKRWARASARSTAAWQFAAEPRSASMKWALRPSLASWAIRSFAAGASRSTTTGSAPSFATARAIAAPMPLAPPVTSTTLLSSSRSIGSRFQAVESGGIVPEDRGLLLAGAVVQVRGNQLHHLRIGSSEQTHRPVRAKHQALPTEGLERDIQIRLEIAWPPVRPVSLRDQAG